MPTFDVSRSRGWYEAECRELGVKITAPRLEQIEATARRTATRALGANAVVAIVMTPKRPEGLLGRIAHWFERAGREGNS